MKSSRIMVMFFAESGLLALGGIVLGVGFGRPAGGLRHPGRFLHRQYGVTGILMASAST
jgi:hypothetical protein